MSVRVFGAFILTIALTTGAASASSFAVMGEAAPASTPSIIRLGQPTPTKMARTQPSSSSWIDKALNQLQQAYLRSKQSGVPRFASVEAILPGKMETPSIIAMGEPAPDIAYEKVASIPKSNHGPRYQPLVIRGGVAGDAFAPAVAASTPAVGANTPAPAPSSDGGKQQPSAPPPPAPAAPPVLAPKGMPE